MPYEQRAACSWPDAAPQDGVPVTSAGTEAAPDILEESPPEHGWLGIGFVWAVYALVPLHLASGVYILTAVRKFGVVNGMDTLPIYFFLALLYLWLARSVQTFKLRGWGVGILMLLISLVASMRLLLGDSDGIRVLAGFATMALEIAWIRYFWMRRPDFT
jgi:hypothetical protein